MKTLKSAIKVDDLRVWCADCSIRIAPHEEQIVVEGRRYHPLCYSKHVGPISRDTPKHSPDVRSKKQMM